MRIAAFEGHGERSESIGILIVRLRCRSGLDGGGRDLIEVRGGEKERREGDNGGHRGVSQTDGGVGIGGAKVRKVKGWGRRRVSTWIRG